MSMNDNVSYFHPIFLSPITILRKTETILRSCGSTNIGTSASSPSYLVLPLSMNGCE